MPDGDERREKLHRVRRMLKAVNISDLIGSTGGGGGAAGFIVLTERQMKEPIPGFSTHQR